MKTIKSFYSLMMVTLAGLTIMGCGGKKSQPESVEEDDSEPVAVVHRDSMVYGICGDGSAMNTLQLISDIGDTLVLDISEANDKGRCYGGIQSGDRMAVMLNGKKSVRMVINQSALLGDWVMPNPLDGSSEMGIRIKEGGIAESIDQPSLTYRSWRLYNGQLELVAIREGGGDEVETNLYDIIFIGPDTLVFKDSEDSFEYNRYKHVERKDIIQLEQASESDYQM